MNVDIVVLTADEAPLRHEVHNAILAQTGPLKIQVHRQIGRPLVSDSCRWETIARARNAGKQLGTAPFLMFVDDDVVLHPGCTVALVNFLEKNNFYGAAAADYLGEHRPGVPSQHVAMGATMFRRESLSKFQFRWEIGKCECKCCCDDLRQRLIGIDYVSNARANHIVREKQERHHSTTIQEASVNNNVEPRILVALDRHHFNLLCSQFIPSLRASGNQEHVSVVAYGFYASQLRKLAYVPNVEVHWFPVAPVHPMVKRLEDFQCVVESLSPQTPVAFWDAGDAMFQQSLKPLWSLISQEPEKLHAVAEPTKEYSEDWICTIQSIELRGLFREWIAKYGVLNGGFGAGTASTILQYLREGYRLCRTLPLLEDQTAMNIYCHSASERWKRIEEGWNYCLWGRALHEVGFTRDGRLLSRKGSPIYVAHGNALTFQRYFSRSNSGWLARYRANASLV